MPLLTIEAILAGLREAARIENGHVPGLADLASAPVLSNWEIERSPAGFHRLVGMVQGHPLVADGWCSTSVVLAVDPAGTWARTISRYYRLGHPFGRLQ